MKFDRNGIRRRRKQRLLDRQNIKLKSVLNQEEDTKNENRNQSRLTGASLTQIRFNRLSLQVVGSLLLIASVYGLLQTNANWALSVQSFTREALTRDYNFSGTVAWVEERLGEFPTLLPTLRLFDNEAVAVFTRPLDGVVVETFANNRQGVIIETGIKTQVHPISTGLVSFVGKTKGTGTTVIVAHSDGKESVYGFLGQVFVRKDDWVYPDSVIGIVDEQSLFLQIREKNQYLNPTDVISFD